ncbi:MAG: DUF4276 family protein [Gammaproteobacteria bacterium]|nr:DUF4276 family protein [Gammaproteobacteria bacterium]
MTASHVVFLVEEPSMEAFLRAFLPRVLDASTTYEVHAFQGKGDLLAKLARRLRAYARWLPEDWRIMVIVDRDQEDCRSLKTRLETIAAAAGLTTRSSAPGTWQVVNRIAIEELEAWYFGDWQAVRVVYPNVPASVPTKTAYRDSDAIRGGTWEHFERILKRHGYHRSGLPKTAVARAMGAEIQPARNRSESFQKFHQAVIEATC